MSVKITPEGPPKTIKYAVRNTGEDDQEVLLALPADGPGQRVVFRDVTIPADADPEYLQRPDLYGVAVTLSGGSSVKLRAEVVPLRRTLDEPEADLVPGEGLPEEERRYYLRATPLAPQTEEIATEAARIAGDGPLLDRVRRLFDEVSGERFGYTWPPPDRGAEGLLRTGKGDCGDFSNLLVAWCRALGIPARAVVGTWAMGRTQAHVWAEFHAGALGWVPADPSVARTLLDEPRAFIAYGVGPDPEACFGGLPGDRIAFVLDMVNALPQRLIDAAEALGPAEPVEAEPGLVIAGSPFAWGRATLDGAAPYLQPDFVISRGDPPYVSWRVRPAGRRGVMALTSRIAGAVTLAVWLVAIVLRLLGTPAPRPMAWSFVGTAVIWVVAGLPSRRRPVVLGAALVIVVLALIALFVV